MRLILVRHGETDGNKSGVVVGHTDHTLNDTGKTQAELLATRLRHEPIAAIVASNLQRAKSTAAILAKHHPHLTVVEDARLCERNFGIHEATPYAEIQAAAKERGLHNYHYRPQDGESGEDMLERVLPLLLSLYKEYKGKTVVVVTHGQMLRVLLMHYLNLPPEKYEDLRHENTGITIIDVSDSGKHKAQVINDSSHLN